MSILKEFKEFAMRGSVVDMAVGIVIGGGFSNIVNSLVKDIVMPPFGLISGGGYVANLFLNLEPRKLLPNGHPVTTLAEAEQAKASVIAYGSFCMAVLNFCIVAASIFLLIKGMNTLRRRLELELPPPPPAPPEPTPQEKLLMEIRDLLKKERA